MLPRTVHAPSPRARRRRRLRRTASFAVLAGGALFALTAVTPDADAADLPTGDPVTASQPAGYPDTPTGAGFPGPWRSTR